MAGGSRGCTKPWEVTLTDDRLNILRIVVHFEFALLYQIYVFVIWNIVTIGTVRTWALKDNVRRS